jgi:hypothetical protein
LTVLALSGAGGAVAADPAQQDELSWELKDKFLTPVSKWTGEQTLKKNSEGV